MKSKTLLLLGVQLRGVFGMGRLLRGGSKATKRRTILFGIAMGFLVLMMGFYSLMISLALCLSQAASAVPPLILFITVVTALITTIFKANGTLFGFRDFDMVMSLPVKSSCVIISRFLFLYVLNLLLDLVMMLPAAVVFGIFTGASPVIWAVIVLSVFFAPMIPMVIATAVSAILTAVATRFRHTNWIVILLSFVFVLAVMGFSFSVQSIGAEDFAGLGAALSSSMARFYPPTLLYARALMGGEVLSFLLFVLLSVGVFALFVLLFARHYVKINTAVMSKSAKGGYKLGELSASSAMTALYRKELRQFFSIPTYVVNTAFGGVFLVALGAASLFFGEQAREIFEVATPFSGELPALGAVAAAILISFCPTTACALSIEGKRRWVLYSLPADSRSILSAKLAVNLTVALPCVAIGGVLLSIGLRASFFDFLLLLFVPAAYTVFSSVAGLWANLKFPKFEWATEAEAVKQSLSVMVSMTVGLLAAAVPLIVFMAAGGLSMRMLAAGCALLALLSSWPLYQRLGRVKLFLE